MPAHPLTLVRMRRPRSSTQPDVWRVNPETGARIGRASQDNQPEIDLWPDGKVSRSHARIWHADGWWWIADLASKRDTWVDGQAIAGPTHLPLWSELRVGDTSLQVVSPAWHRVRHKSLVIDFELSPTFNLALSRAAVPLVSHVFVRNWGSGRSRPAQVTFSLADDRQRAAVSVPPLEADATEACADPRFTLGAELLDELSESREVHVFVRIDDEETADTRATCRLLPANEWSLQARRTHRLSLAAFVLPNHELVEHLVSDALACRNGRGPGATLQAIYEQLHTEWAMASTPQPPSLTSASQTIRLPHQVLRDTVGKRGHGTCLDLALIMAACLEHVQLCPLIAVVDLGASLHALVGCRTGESTSLEPILVDHRRLVDDAVWADPNGVTRDSGQRCEFSASSERSLRMLASKPLAFGLDVNSARLTERIAWLPYSVQPRYRQSVARALECASREAESENRPVGTIGVLIAFLSDSSSVAAQIFTRLNRVPQNDASVLSRTFLHGGGDVAATPVEPGPRLTKNLQLAVEGARAMAKQQGSAWVSEEHVLLSLLNVRDSQAERGIRVLGIDRQAVRRELEALVGRDQSPLSAVPLSTLL